MKLTHIIITATLMLTACKSQAALPTLPAKSLPTETPLPAATPSPIPTPSDVFGAIPLNSVEAFSIEPVAQAIFEEALQGYVASGAIQEYRVDRIAVFPSGNGTLIAEIMYSLRTDSDPWPDDFGTLGADNWITGKCSRFDLIATETEHQLKNKRLCG